MHIALGIFVCGGMGFCIVLAGCRIQSKPAVMLLQVSLAAGFGLGAFSVLFVLSRLLGVEDFAIADLIALALVVGCWMLVRRRTGITPIPIAAERRVPRWLRIVLGLGFALALSAAMYCAMRRAISLPNGEGWDAFAIWNLHARFLFRGGMAWRDGFSSLIPWSHPDYPLLLPAAIAHFWAYLGHESHAVESIIGLIFTISTAGVLFSALLLVRGRNLALLGCMTLLTTPAFIEQGTSQYADVPLSFFLLATVVLLCLYDAFPREFGGRKGLLVLAGLSGGFAAWTKNEGILFLLAVLVGPFLVSVGRRRNSGRPSPKEIRFTPFLLGALPVFVLILWFKKFVAPPGDLFGSLASTAHKLLSDTRYGAISQWFAKQFLRFGHWLWVPGTVLLAGIFLALKSWPLPECVGSETGTTLHDPASSLNVSVGSGREEGFRVCILALLITLAGYFFIYVITPYDVYWHLRFSLNRLFLQLWPSAIFLCCLRMGARWRNLAYAPGGSK